jgi:hypothetical protein
MTDSPDTQRSALAERSARGQKSRRPVARPGGQGAADASADGFGDRGRQSSCFGRRTRREFAETYDVTVSWLLGETADQLEMDDPRLQLAARELSKLKPDDLDRLLRLLASMRSSDAEEGGVRK